MEIHAILTVTLACFLPGRAKDLSAPRYLYIQIHKLSETNVVQLSKIGALSFFVVIVSVKQ